MVRILLLLVAVQAPVFPHVVRAILMFHTWQDGVATFALSGKEAFRQWLAKEGVANIQALNALIASATPWWKFVPKTQVE